MLVDGAFSSVQLPGLNDDYTRRYPGVKTLGYFSEGHRYAAPRLSLKPRLLALRHVKTRWLSARPSKFAFSLPHFCWRGAMVYSKLTSVPKIL